MNEKLVGYLNEHAAIVEFDKNLTAAQLLRLFGATVERFYVRLRPHLDEPDDCEECEELFAAVARLVRRLAAVHELGDRYGADTDHDRAVRRVARTFETGNDLFTRTEQENNR